ncbi:MAG TPA: 4'-phosphopantetheinyl transferase superfamily protein [Candidatus Methylomirabilis sp.]|nr:4'-phosphopantetheinyl transferase superfamily protein [Candidatus Methylomirabilis sp.]
MHRPVITRLEKRGALRRAWAGCRGEGWLSNPEREVYAHLQDARRREAWLFGRLLSKELILDTLAAARCPGWAVDPVHIQVLSRDGLGRPTRPRVLLKGRLQPCSLSLAHSEQTVVVGLSQDGDMTMGVDLTPIQSPGVGFLDLWFTPRERAWIWSQSDQAPRWAATLWAVKEAFYKATNRGEGFTPRRIEVRVDPPDGYAIRCDGARPRGGCLVRVATTGGEVVAAVLVGLRPERTT